MVHRRVRVLEVTLFLGILAAWAAALSRADSENSGTYALGWPGVTAVFSIGLSALAASAAGSLIRGFVRDLANERRAERRLAARPPLPAWTDVVEPLRNLARHAYLVLAELEDGTPVEGDAAWRVGQWRAHVAGLEEEGRHALERRGLAPARLTAGLDDAMVRVRGDVGAEVDRIVCTFLAAAAAELPRSPYRG